VNYKLIATCPNDIVESLGKELKDLGARKIEIDYASVHFETSEENFYRVHLWCRQASRILWIIKESAAKHDKMLRDQARRIKWNQYFTSNKTFKIEGIQADRGPEHMTSNQISKAVREGLQDSFDFNKEKVPSVNLKEPDVNIVVFAHKGRCTMAFDTSYKALHKRGYRTEGHPAPIKETLAATLLDLIDYDGNTAFYDPMAGSGTIAIEATSLALNKAPLIHRKKDEFGFERLKTFNRELWRNVQDHARRTKLGKPESQVFLADINRNYVEKARSNALRARVEKHMEFNVGSFFDLDAPSDSGIMVTNLPYGERLKNSAEDIDEEFYKRIGDTLKHKYKGWKAGLLVAEDTPFKFIGLKPKRKISLMNGAIKVKFLIFEMW
jgi:putative N6-adenine-specific DNA methylase